MTKILHDAAATFMRYCFRKRILNHNGSSGCAPDARWTAKKTKLVWARDEFCARTHRSESLLQPQLAQILSAYARFCTKGGSPAGDPTDGALNCLRTR